MEQLQTPHTGWRRLTPRAGVRVQLVAAALLWLVGTSILLVRGVFYVLAPDEYARFGNGIALLALVAIGVGLVKARLVLIRYARRAVRRIHARGHACFFGFFAPSSWLFILVMMGGGMMLRRTPLVEYWWGRTFLGVLYIAVGTALAIADVIFWRAAVGGVPAGENAATEPDVAGGRVNAGNGADAGGDIDSSAHLSAYADVNASKVVRAGGGPREGGAG